MSVSRALLLIAMSTFAVTAFAVLQLPPDMTVEATGPHGAIIQYNAGATGSGDDENGRPIDSATCSPASGSQFGLGTTTVNCSGSNGGTGSFKVNVVDTTAPTLDLPRDIGVPGSGNPTTQVTFNAAAHDIVDGSVSVTCTPGSGAFFPTGTTTVLCEARDSRWNNSTGTFTVTVFAQPPPPPQVDDITREATGPNGAVVTFTVDGGTGDDENGRPISSANCSPASGSTFPLGQTTVQCTGGASFKVTIVDTTPPALLLPGNITTQNQVVSYLASAQDIVDGSVAVTCSPSSGSTFPIGTTTVVCSAADTRGNASNGTFNVTVEETTAPDTEAPTIVSISASPDKLQPPNGKLVPVTLTVNVIDNIDDSPLVTIFDVTSNESISDADWDLTAPLTVELRADRDPKGDGRVYTIWVEAMDDAGNRSVGTTTVTVPHDSSGTSQPATAQPVKKRRSARS